MFDRSIEIKMTVRSAEGAKVVNVGYPSDEALVARFAGRKVIFRGLGRGRTELDRVITGKADLALYEAIRCGDSPDVEEAEATTIADKLCYTEAIEVESIDGAYRITLDVLGGETTHTLKVPSEFDKEQFRNHRSRTIFSPNNRTENYSRPLAGAEVYDKYVESIEGYRDAETVPVVHKFAVVAALLEQLALDEAEPDPDPNSPTTRNR